MNLRMRYSREKPSSIHRYVLSYKYLTDALSEADYRTLMAAHG